MSLTAINTNPSSTTPCILAVNTVARSSSTAVTAHACSMAAESVGCDMIYTYGRGRALTPTDRRITPHSEVLADVVATRLLDRHASMPSRAVDRLERLIARYMPSLVHLHNVHGYYLDFKRLFAMLERTGIPVLWTLHDYWSMSGHCPSPAWADCHRIGEGCGSCPQRRVYPASWFVDRSARNRQERLATIASLSRLHLACVSQPLADTAAAVFRRPVAVIPNGVDCDLFVAAPAPDGRPLLLGVANVWTIQKGYHDMLRLRSLMPSNWRIRLVGLTNRQLRHLPDGIEGTLHLYGDDLVAQYHQATVIANPTLGESQGMVSYEALACDRPVVVYAGTGADSFLAFDPTVGISVPRGNVEAMATAVQALAADRRPAAGICRRLVTDHFSLGGMIASYAHLYRKIINNQ